MREIEELLGYLQRVYEGDVGPQVQTATRPLIAKVKELGLVQELINELKKKGFGEFDAQVLAGAHPYYTRWKYVLPSWHPIFILKLEHIHFMGLGAESVRKMFEVWDCDDLGKALEILKEIEGLLKQWKGLESHMVREENALFPVLERLGYDEITAIKWDEHQVVREAFEKVQELLDQGPSLGLAELKTRLRQTIVPLNKAAGNHYSAEDRDVFNLALDHLSRAQWLRIRRDFDELGYPEDLSVARVPTSVKSLGEVIVGAPGQGDVQINGMWLSVKQIEGIFNVLPVDITFVDSNDQVRFFNELPDRIFPRARSVIGREVRRCHPRKSLHLVNRILEDFKSGKRDVAEFWIQYRGRFVHIRYFAVRDPQGEYLGTLEVTQDVTRIRELEGEKRLLDEE